MVREYTPDKWLILKLEGNRHIFASWSGGYLGSDSWRLSTKIEKFVDYGTSYKVFNASGSIYHLRKGGEGTNAYTAGVLRSFMDQDLELTIDPDFFEDMGASRLDEAKTSDSGATPDASTKNDIIVATLSEMG